MNSYKMNSKRIGLGFEGGKRLAVLAVPWWSHLACRAAPAGAPWHLSDTQAAARSSRNRTQLGNVEFSISLDNI